MGDPFQISALPLLEYGVELGFPISQKSAPTSGLIGYSDGLASFVLRVMVGIIAYDVDGSQYLM